MSGFLNILLAGGVVSPPAPILPDLNLISLTYDSFIGDHATNYPELDELVGFGLNPTGTKMWIHQDFDSAVPKLISYDLTTAWDITTATNETASAQTNVYSTDRYQDFQWGNNGESIYFVAYNTGEIHRIDVATPYTMDWLATPVPDQTYDATTYTNSTLLGLYMFADGTKFVLSANNGRVAYYTMSVPWDLNTVSWDSTFGSASSATGTEQDIIISRNGLRVWVVTTSDIIAQWDLTTPFAMAEVTGVPDATFTLTAAPGVSKTLYIPVDRNELYVGQYGTSPSTTSVQKYTW